MLIRSSSGLYAPISVDEVFAFVTGGKQGLIKAFGNAVNRSAYGHVLAVFNRRSLRRRSFLLGHRNRISSECTVITADNRYLNCIFTELQIFVSAHIDLRALCCRNRSDRNACYIFADHGGVCGIAGTEVRIQGTGGQTQTAEGSRGLRRRSGSLDCATRSSCLTSRTRSDCHRCAALMRNCRSLTASVFELCALNLNGCRPLLKCLKFQAVIDIRFTAAALDTDFAATAARAVAAHKFHLLAVVAERNLRSCNGTVTLYMHGDRKLFSHLGARIRKLNVCAQRKGTQLN